MAGAAGQNPLQTADTSSPRSTLSGFLETMDRYGEAAVAYRENPSAVTFAEMDQQVRVALRYLDLVNIAAGSRAEIGEGKAVMLWEVLSRIELPPLEEVPDESAMTERIREGTPPRYRIPPTEIAIHRVEEGARANEYLFAPSTVSKLSRFYDRMFERPYLREITLEHPRQAQLLWGGWWLIPPQRAEALPDVLRGNLGGQALWKWLALGIVYAIVFGLVYGIHRWFGHPSGKGRLGLRLRRMLAPGSFVLLAFVMNYFFRHEIQLRGQGLLLAYGLLPVLVWIAFAALVWQLSLALAEAVVASPKISDSGLDASLLRLLARFLGVVAVIGLLFLGAQRMGLPVYGLLAGLSVGGVAVALAAKTSLENFLGSLSLFADRPVRVGDFCRYEGELGTIEEIGMRSTRIRGIDRTVTTIPNAIFSEMKITNLTRRDRMLVNPTLSLRYETTPDQLRYVLAKLRELLLAHPRITADPARVRFGGFGDCSLNVDVFAYVNTQDWNEFLGIREDLHLRMMDVVADSGTGFAFPSRTLYFARDKGLDSGRSQRSEEEVQRWRAEHKLPFPELDLEFRKTHGDTLDYPPAGSSSPKPDEIR